MRTAEAAVFEAEQVEDGGLDVVDLPHMVEIVQEWLDALPDGF